MSQVKLTISLVVLNGAKYLPMFFSSLKKQTYQNFCLKVLDNGSDDGTREIIMNELNSYLNRSSFLEKDKNIGFGVGHNELFAGSDSEYFLIANHDIFLGDDILAKMVDFLDNNKDVAAVAPRLNRWDFANNKLTNEVDSLGLKVFHNRRVIDTKSVEGQTSAVEYREVFGLSGACVMYRRDAVKEAGGLFDNVFFLYKEDVDLSYRLRQNGWQSFVLFNATAWHDRTGKSAGNSDFKQAINKLKQSDKVKFYSYRNHLITLYKNEYWQNFLFDLPWILWYELKKMIWFLFFNRKVLRAWKEIWRMRGELKKKREAVKRLRKINWKQMRRVMGFKL